MAAFSSYFVVRGLCYSQAKASKSTRESRPTAALPADSKGRSLRDAPIAEAGTWYCEECKEHVRPGAHCKDYGRGLSEARTAHIARRHPGRPASDFPRIREVATVATKPRRVLKGKPAWTCFWCRQGLPRMDKRAREASIRKHLQQCKKAPQEPTAGSNLRAWARERTSPMQVGVLRVAGGV